MLCTDLRAVTHSGLEEVPQQPVETKHFSTTAPDLVRLSCRHPLDIEHPVKLLGLPLREVRELPPFVLQEAVDVSTGHPNRSARLEEQMGLCRECAILQHVVNPIVCHHSDWIHIGPQADIRDQAHRIAVQPGGLLQLVENGLRNRPGFVPGAGCPQHVHNSG